MGRCCQDNILCHIDSAGRELCKEECPLTACIADGGTHEASVFLRHKEGRRVPVAVRVQPIRDAKGAIVGAMEIFNDDSAQREERRRIDAMSRLAFLDPITQLPNRRFMEMSVQTALSEYQVHKDPCGALMIDLDQFKEINDAFGHSCGDRALRQAAQTLTGSLRPTDTLGRWGGDELLAIVRNIDLEVLKNLAERCTVMVAGTAVPSNDERMISLSISVGAALVRPGETAEELIQRADQLMYRSKASGRGRATTE